MVSLSWRDDDWEAQVLLTQVSGAFSRFKSAQPYSHLQFLSYSIFYSNLYDSETVASYACEVLPWIETRLLLFRVTWTQVVSILSVPLQRGRPQRQRLTALAAVED